MERKWVEEKVGEWVSGVGALARIAKRYPQTAYMGFAVSLQSEWQYICRAVPGVEALLQPVEDAIVGEFIPALLDIQPGELTPTLRRLLGHGVKQGGMNLRNPVEGAARMRQTSVDGSKILVASLLGGEELNCEQHAVSVRAASKEARKERVEAELGFVDELKTAAPKEVRKRYERAGKNGSWLTVRPDILSGTLLSRQEFVDNARIRLNLKVLDLPQHCDGCGAGFSVDHALSCKKGGLVSIRHDDVRDEAGALAELALPKSRVSYEPHTFYGTARGLGGGGDSGGVQQQSWQRRKGQHIGPRAVEKRGILHPGRACDGHGCKILPRLNLCEGAGKGGAREEGQV